LIHPVLEQGNERGSNGNGSRDFGPIPESLSNENIREHERRSQPEAPIDKIVVRVEVTDTGTGIRPQDMARTKLFCK
jgi:hypothetical protein